MPRPVAGASSTAAYGGSSLVSRVPSSLRAPHAAVGATMASAWLGKWGDGALRLGLSRSLFCCFPGQNTVFSPFLDLGACIFTLRF